MKNKIVFGLIVAGLLVLLVAWPAVKTIRMADLIAIGAPAWPVGFPELSVSAERARLERLGAGYTVPGNAADIYHLYLPGERQEGAWEVSEELLSVDLLKPENDEQRALVDKAIEDYGPDLDRLLEASRKKDYQLWGVYFQVDQTKSLFAQEYPKYLNLLALARLLAARGDKLDKQGETAEAEEHYLAVVRIGGHLEREPLLIGYAIGRSIKNIGAQKLVALHQESGRPDLATAWTLYNESQEARPAPWAKFMALAVTMSPEKFSDLIKDDDLPVSLRLEALNQRHLCLIYRPGRINLIKESARCAFRGTPQWVLDLEEEMAVKDDLWKMFMENLKAHGPRELLKQAEIMKVAEL